MTRSRILLRVYLALTAAAFFWGAGFAVARYALRSISPLMLLAGQGLCAAAAQLVWTAARGRLGAMRPPRSLFWPLAALGLAGQNILNGVTWFGLAYTTATNAALLYGSSPILIAILAALWLRESIGSGKVLGAVLGLMGVALIITQGHFHALRLHGMMFGNLLEFGGALYWAFYSVATRRIAQEVSPEVYTFYVLTLGAVGPLAWVWAGQGRFPLAGLAWPTLLAVAFLGISTGTVAINFWNWALSQIEAGRVGVFSYLEPVFATVVAMILLEERLTLASGAGAALVIGGIFVSNVRWGGGARLLRKTAVASDPPAPS